MAEAIGMKMLHGRAVAADYENRIKPVVDRLRKLADEIESQSVLLDTVHIDNEYQTSEERLSISVYRVKL
jgi:hypothetical protein